MNRTRMNALPFGVIGVAVLWGALAVLTDRTQAFQAQMAALPAPLTVLGGLLLGLANAFQILGTWIHGGIP